MKIPTLPPTRELPPMRIFADCKKGETAAKTGCTPATGEGGAGGGKKQIDEEEERIKRPLPGLKKKLEWEKKSSKEGLERSEKQGKKRDQLIAENQPSPEKMEGQEILRVPGSPVAAFPATGKKSSKKWVVFDVEKREELAQIDKVDIRDWLANHAVREIEDLEEGK